MTTTAIGASRVASERRSGSEFVQSNECEEFMREEVAEAVRVDDGHPGFTVEVSTLDPGGIGEFDGW